MSKKILVADDSVVIQKSIGITFAQEDFQVTFVGNGEEAFQRAKEIKPDLILADTSMPKLSGAELCRKFRQDSDFRRVPILLLANSQETFNLTQLESFGANDFIQKPFESSQLLEKVKGLLSKPATEASVAKPTAPAIENVVEPVFSKPAANVLAGDTVTAIRLTEEIPQLQAKTAPTLDVMEGFVPTVSNEQRPSLETLASLDVLTLDDNSNTLDERIEELDPHFEEETKIVRPDSSYKTPHTSASVTAATPEPSIQLSEQQIEQIVAKVFRNVIERIAWEVVPEMAERMIKEEIQKISNEV